MGLSSSLPRAVARQDRQRGLDQEDCQEQAAPGHTERHEAMERLDPRPSAVGLRGAALAHVSSSVVMVMVDGEGYCEMKGGAMQPFL